MMKLTVIPGDGIGPEITAQVIRVLKHVNAPFEYQEHQAGEIALQTMGDLLPQTTIDSITANKLADKALPLLFAGNYGGDHWLASFALMALDN